MKSSSEILVAAALALSTLAACNSGSSTKAHADQNPARCAECHMPEFGSTQRPPHPGARPTTCGVCHTQTSWHGARIDHPFWELTGAHGRAAADRNLAGADNRVKCFWCHRGEPPMFRFTSHECVACHSEDRKGVTFPGHDGFSISCETCHSTEAWKPAQRPEPKEPARKAPTPENEKTTSKSESTPVPKATARPAPRRPPRPTTTEVATSPPEPTSFPTPALPPPQPKAPPVTPLPLPLPDITSHASRRR